MFDPVDEAKFNELRTAFQDSAALITEAVVHWFLEDVNELNIRVQNMRFVTSVWKVTGADRTPFHRIKVFAVPRETSIIQTSPLFEDMLHESVDLVNDGFDTDVFCKVFPGGNHFVMNSDDFEVIDTVYVPGSAVIPLSASSEDILNIDGVRPTMFEGAQVFDVSDVAALYDPSTGVMMIMQDRFIPQVRVEAALHHNIYETSMSKWSQTAARSRAFPLHMDLDMDLDLDMDMDLDMDLDMGSMSCDRPPNAFARGSSGWIIDPHRPTTGVGAGSDIGGPGNGAGWGPNYISEHDFHMR